MPLTPSILPDSAGIPILICAGRRDPIVPVENVARLAALLQRGGAQVRQSWSSGGHELTDADAEAVIRWLPEAAQCPVSTLPDPAG